ncbi:homoserine dehydrogenase [Salipaludibacillus keqinensis]|uniref:Homoserine dehydrogenase n=1 Tax=Salipaludibacillus keqinensis TaxID=2045207 RepID=A0A323TC47_9BACI|nr:homoserine dehydrogenase [Salipaludibacillus keqinensis]PYZ92882.1 homoserine dehydrogenase [Salipaludibacillus keqinensis]
MIKKVGIIGFGTVGSGVYETLLNKRTKINQLINGDFVVPVVLVKNLHKTRDVPEETEVIDQFDQLSSRSDLDAVIEASPDSYTAYPYVKTLLKNGTTVVTANKELMANHGEELLQLAAENQCRLFFEAAVAGGIPILTSIRHTLKTNDIEKIEGIVNGTSNFILTKMRDEGAAFNRALKEAQEKGYAEAIPDKDIDGWDAYFKTVILSHWIFGTSPTWLTDKPSGIRGIDVRDLLLASEFNGRIKHVASIERDETKIEATVRPKLVLSGHSLYGVEGVNNGIHVKGSIVGSLLFQGAGAGKFPTASAVIEDLINHWTDTSEETPLSGIEFEQTRLNIQNVRTNFGAQIESKTDAWLVTGKQLALQLENQNTVTSLTNIKKRDGREALLVKGKETDVKEVMTALNDSVWIYPVCGEDTDWDQIQAVNNISAS